MSKIWVSHSPHIKQFIDSNIIYGIIIISLIPTTIWGSYVYSLNALYLIVASLITSIGTDIIFLSIKAKKFTYENMSSAVVGLLIGLCMPPSAQIYYPIIASFIAIGIIRICSGGIGKNYVSEVSASVLLVSLIFSSQYFDCFLQSTTKLDADLNSINTIYEMSQGGMYGKTVLDLFLGNKISVNAIGMTSIAGVLIGGIVLCIFKVIDYKIPLVYLLSFGILCLIFKGYYTTPFYLLSGPLMFTAFFIATDFGVAPKYTLTKILYGITLSIVTAMITFYNGIYYAPLFACLFVNLVFSALRGVYRPRFKGETKNV